MQELTRLIKEDMKPALGVTEPGAIAFAVAKARDYTEGEIEKVIVSLNSGMYKNAFTCGIPNSDEVGNLYAAALGAIAGDAQRGLEALWRITASDNEKAKEWVLQGKVEVQLSHIGSAISIEATVITEKDRCTVKIAGGHTDIHSIVKNETVIWKKDEDAANEAVALEDASICHFTLAEILNYIETVDGKEISFIREAFEMNMALLSEGLESEKTSFGPWLYRENGRKMISEDAHRTAQLFCGGAIEARVLGLSRPAMSITGSGAHGIIATLPLLAYQQVHKEQIDEVQVLRATALSFLVTMYIKEYSGKLSAFCGCGIAAGTGMACGLCFLQGGDLEKLTCVIRNMASGITGMICDGGNQGCVMKGIVAVDAAFRAVDLAMEGICVEAVHGINGKTPEETMRNMGRIASPGMEKTEEVIVQIMQEK